MTKPWPQKLSKKDPEPDEYADLSVETQRLVVHGDHVYFFLWCWDMDEQDHQVSVLFRVHRSFDQPGERLAAIKTEMVDLCLHDDRLVALENGQGDDGGFGVVHRLVPGASKPESSERFALGHVFKSIAVGPKNTLFAAGTVLQRFDGKSWHGTKLPEKCDVRAIASNGKIALAVGADGLILALEPEGEPRVITAPNAGQPDYDGIDIAGDGTVFIAGHRGVCLEGSIEELEPLPGVPETPFNDTCMFQGKRYWSAAGDEGVGGLYVQNGKRLELVFERQNCFALTPTETHLFIASEAGIVRFDGNEEWKAVSTSYDEDQSVWVMRPGEPEEAYEDDDGDDDGDDDDDDDDDEEDD